MSSNSSSPFSNFLWTVPCAPTTISITLILMLHSFFSSQARCKYSLILSLSFIFIQQILFQCQLALGLVFWPGLGDPFVSQNPRECYGSHSLGSILVCASYYFTPWEFFTSALDNRLLLESEWQVSSILRDSFKYSGRSQQCCSLDCLLSSSYFQVLQSLYQSFGDCTKSTNYNWYNCQFHVPHLFFNSLTKSRYLSFFRLPSTLLCDQPGQQSQQFCKFSFSFLLLLLLLLILIKSGCQYLKIPGEFLRLILPDRFCVVHIPLVRIVLSLIFIHLFISNFHWSYFQL